MNRWTYTLFIKESKVVTVWAIRQRIRGILFHVKKVDNKGMVSGSGDPKKLIS